MKYTTKLGDTWDVIAYSALGSERAMPALIAANPQHADTVVFKAGVELNLPEIQQVDGVSSNLPPWKRGAL